MAAKETTIHFTQVKEGDIWNGKKIAAIGATSLFVEGEPSKRYNIMTDLIGQTITRGKTKLEVVK